MTSGRGRMHYITCLTEKFHDLSNKLKRLFCFCLERFISPREINPFNISPREINLFSRNSLFLTTSDLGHRWDETHVIFIFFLTKITLLCTFDVTDVNK